MSLVSVIIPSYNHAKFIAQSIESVLCQQNVDFELLIADDGSSDNTLEVLEPYRDDSRIRIFDNKINQGAGVVTKQLIEHAKGQYIALLNSDDFWSDELKLSKQVKFLEENPTYGACFGKANFVDEFGNNVSKLTLEFGDVFDKGKNRSRGAWLRYFLDHGNCICHPTMLIRKKCYEELGVYKNSLRQLPDYEMWVSLVKKYDIHIFDDVFINFRILPGENASSNSEANSIRIFNEQYLVTKSFFDGIEKKTLLDGFRDLLVNPEELDRRYFIECESALILLNYSNQWLGQVYKQAAIEKLYTLLNNPESGEVLKGHFKFSDRDFHHIIGNHDCLRPDFVKRPVELSLWMRAKTLLYSLKRRILAFVRG